MRKIVLVLVGLVFGVGCASTFTEEELKIEGEIEAKIREEIKKPEGELTDEDLKSLRNLNLNGCNITSIKGLGRSQSINHLILENNSISDISELAKLKQLEVLGIGGNPITDISAIAELENLHTLSIGARKAMGIPAKDLSPIAKLKNLRKLTVYGTKESPINSLSFIEGLNSLEQLSFGGVAARVDFYTFLTSLDSLSEVPKLRSFYIRGNQKEINDLTALGNLNELNYLGLVGSNITSLKGLGNSKSIAHLDLNSNDIDDVSELLKVKQLKVLVLEGNPITKEQVAELQAALPECKISHNAK